MMANDYVVYSWCKTKLDEYVADKALSNEERAVNVCEAGVEALRGLEAVLQHNLQELVGQVKRHTLKPGDGGISN